MRDTAKKTRAEAHGHKNQIMFFRLETPRLHLNQKAHTGAINPKHLIVRKLEVSLLRGRGMLVLHHSCPVGKATRNQGPWGIGRTGSVDL